MSAQAIHIAETSYRDEFKKYTPSLIDAGFPVQLIAVKIYTKAEEIPEADRTRLRQEHNPFFAEDAYQILMKDSVNETLWILDQTGIARKIAPPPVEKQR